MRDEADSPSGSFPPARPPRWLTGWLAVGVSLAACASEPCRGLQVEEGRVAGTEAWVAPMPGGDVLRAGVGDAHTLDSDLTGPVWVARTSSDGVVAWRRSFTAGRVFAVATSPAGFVALAGDASVAVDVEGHAIPETMGSYVVTFDAAGAIGTVSSIDGVRVVSAVVDDDGAVTVAGFDFGAPGTARTLVARMDASGGMLWTTPLGASEDSETVSVLARGDGSWLVAFSFSGAVDLGPAGSFTSEGGLDVAVALVDARGAVTRAARFGGAADEGRGVFDGDRILLAAPSERRWVVATSARGDLDVGGARLAVRGSADVLVLTLSEQLEIVDARLLGGPGYDAVGGIARGAHGEIALVGISEGGASVGPFSCAGLPIVVLDPDGVELGSHCAPARFATGDSAVLHEDGVLDVGGFASPDLDLGAGPIGDPSPTALVGFVGRYRFACP